MRKIGVLVSGRGSNLQAIMDRIADGFLPLEIAVVISDKEDAFALERAGMAGIKNVVIPRKGCASKEEFEAKITAELQAAGCELVVLAGFMRILSADFVNTWEHKIINIHPAILPSFPGLHGQKQALDYGVKVAGCTVHFVDAGTDSGPIILQKVVPVMDDDTEDSLSERILVQEHIAMPEALKLWAENKLEIVGRKVRIKA
ncbi:MAG: phosphoribosylglycinamide formyltransferase [Phascolarctobacterium sp.]|nr:phosphoribosylglycinamide formyltransferase [Phascolarctobacterium sp.]